MKILSSSSSGYMIISKLIDSTYDIAFGFPNDEWNEQKVTVTISGNDAGYLLKNFTGRGWGFVNLQSNAILMPNRNTEARQANETADNNDTFSSILATVVNDPSIRQKKKIVADIVLADIVTDTFPTINTRVNREITISEDSLATGKIEDNAESVNPVLIKTLPVLKDTSTSGKPVVSVNTGKPVSEAVVVLTEDPKKERTGIPKNEITKVKAESSSEGMQLTYLDLTTGSKADTITVLIPAPDKVSIAKTERQSKKQPKTDTKTRDSKFIDMELPNPNVKTDTETGDIQVIMEKKTDENVLPAEGADSISSAVDSTGIKINSDCNIVATNEDFLLLRRDMAAEANEEAMKRVAIRKFKTTCFTTGQIKNLGVLFIGDGERYKFYVAVYPFVYDPQNFGSLQESLTDNDYITKFKTMFRL